MNREIVNSSVQTDAKLEHLDLSQPWFFLSGYFPHVFEPGEFIFVFLMHRQV